MDKIIHLERYPLKSFKTGKFSDDETYLLPHKSYAPDSYKSIFNYPFIFSYIRNKFTISNVANGKFGYAYCHPYEVPDLNIALGVAWARYCGEEIPKIKKYLTKEEFVNLENGICICDEDGNNYTVIGKDLISEDCLVVYRDTELTMIYFDENYFYIQIEKRNEKDKKKETK
jgi:hypothetical protein